MSRPYQPAAARKIQMYQNLKLLTLLAVSAASQAYVVRAPPSSFVLIGDSTTAHDGGWGDGFCGSTDTNNTAVVVPGTPCSNIAHSGATTGTFVADGYFATALDTIKAEVAKKRRTYVTIQFGHNDQKIAPPESMAANLTTMVAQIREAGGEPVLVTPLTRRNFFSNGTVNDILGPWANATKSVAAAEHTHLIELLATSIKYITAIGATSSHVLNLSPSDNTHLNPNGATVFSRMVADLLQESYHDQLPILKNPALSYNISHGIASY